MLRIVLSLMGVHDRLKKAGIEGGLKVQPWNLPCIVLSPGSLACIISGFLSCYAPQPLHILL